MGEARRKMLLKQRLDVAQSLKDRMIISDFTNPKEVRETATVEPAEKQLRIMFHIPANSFSARFMFCWTNTVMHMALKGHIVELHSPFSPNLYESRNRAWGADEKAGPNQLPYQGKDYDYIISIDSDQYWTISDIDKLIAGGEKYGFYSGIYLMANRWQFATILTWDENDPYSGIAMDFKNLKAAMDEDGFIRPAWTGFGFMIMKKGILEAIGYPWMRPVEMETKYGKYWLFDDHSFHYRAQKLGYQVIVDPTLRVGHEKLFVV